MKSIVLRCKLRLIKTIENVDEGCGSIVSRIKATKFLFFFTRPFEMVFLFEKNNTTTYKKMLFLHNLFEILHSIHISWSEVLCWMNCHLDGGFVFEFRPRN